MKYVFGYAGVPHEDFEAVQRKASFITGEGSQFYGRPLPRGANAYNDTYLTAFLKFFAGLLRNDREQFQDAYFAVIYRTWPGCDPQRIADVFEPSIFTFPIPWTITYGSRQLREEHRNALIDALADGSRQVKKVLPHIHKELAERSNKTPLLLPLKNFDDVELPQLLRDIQIALRLPCDPTKRIRERVSQFERVFPAELDQMRRPPQVFFTNPQNIRFRAPGKDRHGSAHPEVDGHPDHCVVAAFKRLGAAYHPKFHYDCTRLSQQILKSQLNNCHSPPEWKTGHPHLNIAPNDAVR